MIAIAAMALNRAIGHEGRIPWHLSKDLKFFKRTTIGHSVVMGRKTFESLGRPLPGRENIVLSRRPLDLPGAICISRFEDIPDGAPDRNIFVIGGAEIYAALLPRCAELLLTIVKRTPEADTFFPSFEDDFTMAGTLDEDADLEIRRYVRRV